MKNAKKNKLVSMLDDDIRPIENPGGAIDFYMPLPDEVSKKWKKRK